MNRNSLAPPGGPALGHRGNHAKGICFIGHFDANGAGSALSTSAMLTAESYKVVGRFNLGTPNPMAVDGKERVRGLGLMITALNGQQWRMAMIDLPFCEFPPVTAQDRRCLPQNPAALQRRDRTPDLESIARCGNSAIHVRRVVPRHPRHPRCASA